MKAYNPNKGQKIRTSAKGVNIDRGFIAHYIVPAADAVAAADNYILTAKATTAVPQTFLPAAFANPLTNNRVVEITGNAASMSGNIVVTGKDADGKALVRNIALNGNAAVSGLKVFSEVESIVLPPAVYQSGRSPLRRAQLQRRVILQ